ncbi:MAG: FHA domain-containing protein [Gemmatimonadaceae bacterium]|nr:FHA domain-containing protein [Gemmatimonadaceae bacterium]
MPYLQYRGQRVTLTQAVQVIGAFDGAALRIPGDDPAARATIRLGADGTGIISRADASSEVSVNGVQLGAEPSPLLHGDKVELGGEQLQYGDDAQGGSTQFISAANVAAHLGAAKGPRKATSATGGRLVSLVDGREYTIADAGASFGREIGNDIVIASAEVSRRHAEIVPAEGGYVLKDLSTNGVLVNGVRVEKEQLLGRADVIRIANEEFRFYADKARDVAAAVAPPSAGAQSAQPATAAAAPAQASQPSAPVSPTAPLPEAPTVPKPIRPSAAREPLATLEVVNEGPAKGEKYQIFTPLANVGRGAHNDVVIADDSVSDSHAKILHRDGHWFIEDQGSTNGTYIGGNRVHGEQQVVGAPDVRFGNVKLTFRPSAATADTGGSTRAIASVNAEQARRMSTHGAPAAGPAPAGSGRHSQGGGAVAHPAHKPEKPVVIPEADLPAKKGCATAIAFVLATAAMAGAGMLAILFRVGG